jgi:hypothetical protein
MAKPIEATPVARGEDARRIRADMRGDAAPNVARRNAHERAVLSSRSNFVRVANPEKKAKTPR